MLIMEIMPQVLSSYANQIDDLGFLITILVGIGFVIAQGVLFYSILFFRAKKGLKADYILGDKWSQLKWVMLPVFFVVVGDLFIDLKTTSVWQAIKQELPETDFQVRIIGQQYSWSFITPGLDGKFGTEDDLSTIGELHIPVNKKVVFFLDAKDVVHSFSIPVLRIKQDALPGRTIKGWFDALAVGKYDIMCTQICGTGHSQMQGSLVVHEAADYEAWVASAAAAAGGPAGASDAVKLGMKVFTEKACVACHSNDGSPRVGPSFLDLFGKKEMVLTKGKEREITVDEAYLTSSIKNPKQDIVKGFPPAMPEQSTLKDDEIAQLVEYIKSLKRK
jgi:cytochrome c oxidase subunit 2